MTVYISGPITGDPDYRQKFEEAESALKTAGYIPLNPVKEIEGIEVLKARKLSYEECMKHDLHQLLFCEGITMLPGWEKSAGATCEHDVAKLTGKTFVNVRLIPGNGKWK